MKNIIKTLLLLAFVTFCATSHAQSPQAVAEATARIYDFLLDGNCDKAMESYQNLKIAVGEFPDIEKRIAECKKNKRATTTTPTTNAVFVDLGLPSGTKWSVTYESGYYSYNEAVKKYGNYLPTEAQWRELIDNCKWTWDNAKNGYKVVGPNSKSIFLPAVGWFDNTSSAYGYYWTSTAYSSNYAWRIFFSQSSHKLDYSDKVRGYSVRLVQNK